MGSIMKLLLTLCTYLLLALPFASWGSEVGTTYLKFIDKARDRSIEVRIWYPAKEVVNAERITYYSAFKGSAISNAPYLSGRGRYPLIMLSHGDRGSHNDQSWLAESLAANGYIVAAPSHWLNTWMENTPEATIEVWERPKDISFTLDRLLSHKVWQKRINTQLIGVAGHSAGGYTALALAGAEYHVEEMLAYCEAKNWQQECDLVADADFNSIDATQSTLSYLDIRIKAVLAMAPALGPAISIDSLNKIQVPVAIVAAEDDELIQFAQNAEVFSQHIPEAELIRLNQGGHFVFMPECTALGKLFTYFHRFDVCGHRSNTEKIRSHLHQTIEQAAIDFFDKNLKAR
jgi:predicted dienelactone hydrolase